MKTLEIENRISLFVLLWCIANIFHSVSFLTYYNGVSALDIIRSLVLLFSCLQLLFNRGSLFFIIALFFSSSVVIILPSSVPNHIFFEGIINITIFTVTIYYIIKKYFLKENVENYKNIIYQHTGPLIRVLIIILYFFVVLHKLNYDFFNPYIGCSGNFFSRILEDFGLLQLSAIEHFHDDHFLFLRNFSIYFAIISEAIIPVMLLIRKTRNFGILYGVFFHIVLALHFHGGIYSFSAMMLVYYSLFFDSKAVVNFLIIFQHKLFRYFVIACVLLIGILNILIPNNNDTLFLRDSTKLLFIGLLFFLIFAVFYGVIFLKSGSIFKSNSLFSFKLKPLGICVAVFICFTGFSPYLGLRTEVCFSMFSNLQTEENLNNHLFMPKSLRFFSYQDKLIQIKSSDIVYFSTYAKDDNIRLVPFEFNRIIDSQIKAGKNFYVNYIYNDQEKVIYRKDGVIYGNRINVYSNSFLRKYMSFRPVYIDNTCQH